MDEDNNNTDNNFPSRIIALLQDEDIQKAVHWLPDGLSFEIVKPDLFEELVLKTHFNSIKFDSFLVRLRSK